MRIARVLWERGPLQAVEIMAAAGLHKNSFRDALKARAHWFQKQPGNLRSPWELTADGRLSLASANGASSGH